MKPPTIVVSALIAVSAALAVFAFARAVATDHDFPGPPPDAPVASIAPGDSGAPAGSAPGGSAPAGSAAAPAARVEIEISGFAFDPAELTVAPGTEVVWINRDSARHTVTAVDFSFDSPVLEEGDSFSFVFDTAGTFDYYCNFHPDMTATITVEG